jgi:hypothetical protein
VNNEVQRQELQETLPDDCYAVAKYGAICGMRTKEIISVIDEKEDWRTQEWWCCTILTRLVPGGKQWQQNR